MKRKKENKLGTYDCSDFGNCYNIISAVYGSDHCI